MIGKAAGTASTPVLAYVATTPPATTVIGAEALTAKKKSAPPPSALRASPTGAVIRDPPRVTVHP